MVSYFRNCGIIFLLLAALSFLAGCPIGLNPKLLQSPPGAVIDVSAKGTEEFLPLSRAVKVAHEHQKKQPPSQIDSVRKNVDDYLTAVKAALVRIGANKSDFATVEAGHAKAKGFDSSTALSDRLTVIEALGALFKAGGPMQGLRQEFLKTSVTQTEKDLFAAFEKSMKTRLMLEIMQIRDQFLSKVLTTISSRLAMVAEARKLVVAQSNAENTIDSLQRLLVAIENLCKRSDINADLLSSMRDSFKKVLELIDEIVAVNQADVLDRAAFAQKQNSLDRDFKPEITKLMQEIALIEAAMLRLNPSQNTHLEDLEKPLPLGDVDAGHLKKTPMQQVEEGLALNKQPLFIAMPHENEVAFIEEYLALKNFKVVVVDLLVLAKHAHALSLDSPKFIEWVSAIIKRLDDRRIVFLHNVGALQFDATIVDDEAKKRAATENLKKLLELVSDRSVIVPITRASDQSLSEIKTVAKNPIELRPYDLGFAQKIVEHYVSDRSQSGKVLSAESVLLLMRISRALKPHEFFVAKMAELITAISEISIEEQKRRAVLTIATKLFDPSLVSDSGVLSLSAPLVERRLKQDPLAFTNSSLKKELRDAIASSKLAQQELAKLLAEIGQAHRASRTLVLDLDRARQNAGALKDDVDRTMALANVINDALQQNGQQALFASLLANAVATAAHQLQQRVGLENQEALRRIAELQAASARAQESMRAFQDDIEARRIVVERLLKDGRESLGQDLIAAQAALGATIGRHEGQLNAAGVAALGDLERQIEAGLKQVNDVAQAKIDQFKESVEKIENDGEKNLAEKLAAKQEELTNFMREQGDAANDQTKRKFEKLQNKINGAIAAADAQIDNKLSELQRKLAEAFKQEQAFGEKLHETKEELEKIGKAQSDETNRRLSEFKAELDEQIRLADKKMKKQIEKYVEQKIALIEQYLKKLDDAMRNADERIKTLNAVDIGAQEKLRAFEEIMEGFRSVKEWKENNERKFLAHGAKIDELTRDLSGAKETYENLLNVAQASMAGEVKELETTIELLKTGLTQMDNGANEETRAVREIIHEVVNATFLKVPIFPKEIIQKYSLEQLPVQIGQGDDNA